MLDHLRIKLLISGNKPHVGHHFCSEILYVERKTCPGAAGENSPKPRAWGCLPRLGLERKCTKLVYSFLLINLEFKMFITILENNQGPPAGFRLLTAGDVATVTNARTLPGPT